MLTQRWPSSWSQQDLINAYMQLPVSPAAVLTQPGVPAAPGGLRCAVGQNLAAGPQTASGALQSKWTWAMVMGNMQLTGRNRRWLSRSKEPP